MLSFLPLKNVPNKALLTLLLFCTTFTGFKSRAYILSPTSVLDFSGTSHGRVPYKVATTTTLIQQENRTTWNETLVLKTNPLQMYLLASSVDGSWSFAKLYLKDLTHALHMSEEGQKRTPVGSAFFLPFLFYKNSETLLPFLKKLNLPTSSDNTPLLQRHHGVPTLVITSAKKINEIESGLWFHQDQFFLQKIKSKNITIEFTNYKRFRYGLWLGQTWSARVANKFSFQTQVNSVTYVEAAEVRALKTKKLSKFVKLKGTVPENVLNFYNQFR